MDTQGRDLVAEERLRYEIDKQFPDHWIDDASVAGLPDHARVPLELPMSVVRALKEKAREEKRNADAYPQARYV